MPARSGQTGRVPAARHDHTDGPAEDEAAFGRYGEQLVDAVDATIADWVRRSVLGTCARSGHPVDDRLEAATTAAAEAARTDVVGRLRALLALDLDDQTITPLQVLRDAVSYPTAVLRDAGVAPVERDEFDRRAFPEDVYGLTPAGFGDVDPALAEPGLVWGAAKAHLHLRRHRSS